MKALIALLLMITPAWSQSSFEMPKTKQLTQDGKPIGTATFHGNRVYLRDTKQQHYATIQFNPDGTRTAYDPNGKIIPLPDVAPPPE